MVATFAHTGGLTGAEVGVAAGTAFLNQKLLTALFGEAAVVEMVRRAKDRLDEALRATFDEERGRFERCCVPAAADLAGDCRRPARGGGSRGGADRRTTGGAVTAGGWRLDRLSEAIVAASRAPRLGVADAEAVGRASRRRASAFPRTCTSSRSSAAPASASRAC